MSLLKIGCEAMGCGGGAIAIFQSDGLALPVEQADPKYNQVPSLSPC
ncbi:hypothetical protein NJ959_07940 [Symplocastrum sp. BBK-W-15]|uniref:Uncharacterized protein n=1 Tax=Limnofasciculus baicalensis BBK-W-15 TaxID=2699891 RepID=A0AAE3GPQ5_9CYAN|nr:hypothetical protein [Limnofasciculus baicalensis BBK-W-15]